jgi:predicted GNAT family acetyltransferase
VISVVAVRDDPDNHRLVIEEDGAIAELVYHLHNGRLVIVHTGVPDQLGGRGIGGLLVRAAVERAAEEHLTVVPQCPFARSWLERNPDVAATVTVD